MSNLHTLRGARRNDASRRLMEAGKQFARPSAFATGRAPTALAAFVKRPQAVRSNRRWSFIYGLSHCMSKRKIWSDAAAGKEWRSLSRGPWSDACFLRYGAMRRDMIARAPLSGCRMLTTDKPRNDADELFDERALVAELDKARRRSMPATSRSCGARSRSA